MKKPTAPSPSLAAPETAPAPDLVWMTPLVDAGTQAASAYANAISRDEALASQGRNAAYLARARGPLEIALTALPGLVAYEAAAAPIIAAAVRMGVESSAPSLVQKAAAGNQIRQIKAARDAFALLEGGGPVHDPGALCAEILQATLHADKQLPSYHIHFANLVGKMQEVSAARVAKSTPTGPSLDPPADLQPIPVGSMDPITEFNVFHMQQAR